MSMTNQHGSKAPVVEIQKLNPKAVIPAYQTKGAAGFDLVSVQDHKLEPGERAVVKTGLAFAVPEGWEMQVRPRSGLAAKNGITVVNAPGTIDSDYRGEVMVILLNTGDKDFYVMAGDRIAQGVIAYAPQAALIQVQDLGETARGAGGLGSTGV